MKPVKEDSEKKKKPGTPEWDALMSKMRKELVERMPATPPELLNRVPRSRRQRRRESVSDE